ncbi:hypothetical protein PBAL39_10830 [Pedobacter sp. BAL39]|nr:hypothetical protein PBAL39_10830 [Pedobacter sp. BAL39]
MGWGRFTALENNGKASKGSQMSNGASALSKRQYFEFLTVIFLPSVPNIKIY